MEVEAVTLGEAAAGGDEVVALVGVVGEFFFVIVPAEGVGGEETVVAGHPPGGVAEILRMIEDGDAVGGAVALGVVIAPGGAGAPSGGIAGVFGGDDVAVAAGGDAFHFVRHGHPLSDADGHGAVFIVAEEEGLVGEGAEGDLEVDEAAAGVGVETDFAFVGADEAAVGGEPAVAGAENADGAVGGLDFAVEDGVTFFFRRAAGVARAFVPEIDTVDHAVGEIERALPRVVGVFAGGRLHREIPGERRAVGGEDRVTIGARRAVAEDVVGKMLAADLDADAVGKRGEFDLGLGGGERGGDSKREQGEGGVEVHGYIDEVAAIMMQP